MPHLFSATSAAVATALTVAALPAEMHYAEGTLQPDDPATYVERVFVTGGIAVAGRVSPWLDLRAGARARAYGTTSGTDRWMMWDVGGKVDVPLYQQQLKGDLTVWRSVLTSFTAGSGTGAGQGGAVGLTLQPLPQPWWGPAGLPGRSHRPHGRAARNRRSDRGLPWLRTALIREILAATGGRRRRNHRWSPRR